MDFDTLAKNVSTGMYHTSLPYGAKGSDERAAYREDNWRRDVEFHEHANEALRQIGVPADAIGAVLSEAWDAGHAYGYSEVVIHAERLGELVAGAAKRERDRIRDALLSRLDGVKHIARESFLPLIDEVLSEEAP